MQDSKFGKVISRILPFVVLFGICVAIAFIFGWIADKQVEKAEREKQEQTQEQSQDQNQEQVTTDEVGVLDSEVSGYGGETAQIAYGIFLNAGPDDADSISEYDTVVIDAQYFEAADIAALKAGGVENVYSYLNVGSLEQFRDYYFLYEKLTLDKYENWEDERWVDVTAPEWGEFMDEKSDEMLAKGVDGFFIDNCDVYYKYHEENVLESLTDILKGIKAKSCEVIINGGDAFVSECLDNGVTVGECFDGVNQESVYTAVSRRRRGLKSEVSFGVATGDDREYFTAYLEKVAAAGGDIYVLEYADSDRVVREAKDYAMEYGWTIYVSDSLNLDTDCDVTGGIAAPTDASGEAVAEVRDPLEVRIDEWLESHTLEEKVGQLFVVAPEVLTTKGGTITALNNSLKEGIGKYPVGGFIFFGSNLKNREQTISMLADIRSVYEENDMPVPFLSVDEEGGMVSRIGNNPAFDVKSTVPMSEIGATGDATYAYNVGTYIGSYLYELGFNMNMAPDADVLSNPRNTVIGNRSFGSDAELVAEMVIAESQALNEQGIVLAVKHYPGHGATAADSHNGYAYTDKTLEELYECELVPFKEAIDSGAGVIMVGHISVPNITDDDVPSSLSHYMITEVLRNQLGFDGIVITDAMNMGAVTKQYSAAEAAVLSIQAGSDIILMPENFVKAYEGVLAAVESGELTEERIDESVRRILREKW